jgi:hypothetical protein
MGSDALTVRRIRLGFGSLALVLGALYMWATRHNMSPDVIAYLDLGDAFLNGHWREGVNGLWSPLFPVVLGSALRLFHPSPYWEFATEHAVVLGTYVTAVVSFDFFLRWAFRYHHEKTMQTGDADVTMLPESTWFVLGFTLFVWFCFRALFFVAGAGPGLFSDEANGGDLLGYTFVFLSAGLLYRISIRGGQKRSFMLLGAVLALGYLARANILAWAPAALAGAAVLGGGLRRSLRGLISAVLVLVVIGLPFVVGLSVVKGRPTVGDSAKLNYVFHVNHVPYTHWPWENGTATGTARHPVRRILSTPAVYEFGTPIAGTYPLGYDMSYWYEGIVPQIDIQSEFRAVRANLDPLIEALKDEQPLILAALTLTVFAQLSGPKQVLLVSLRDGWVLLVLSFWGLAIFTWVYFVMRHVTPFLLLGWMGIFALIRVPNSVQSRRVLASVLLPVMLVLCLPVARQTVRETRAIAAGRIYGTDSAGHPLWEVADGLRRTGVEPGDWVTVVGNGGYHAYWARLARVKIVAEVPDEEAFWKLDTEEGARVMQALASTRARVVVARAIPDAARNVGWTRVGSTTYYQYRLR